GRPVVVPSGAGDDPDVGGGLQVPRRDRTGRLRRQGQEPAQPSEQLLRRPVRAPPAHPPDGHHGGGGGVDGRLHRGRGAAARVLLDQGVRPALQREVPRRQELPVAGRHAARGLPPPAGHAGAQEEGRALLRPVRPRLGDPRDPRPAAEGVPGADLLERRLPTGRAGGPAVPARLHRQVLGAVRGQGRPGRAPGDRRRLLRLHGRSVRALRPAARAADGRGRRGPGLRAGRAPARRHRGAHPGHREAGGRARGRDGRRRDRGRRGPARGGRPGLPRARRPGPRTARLRRRQGRGAHHRRAGRAVPGPGLRRRARLRRRGRGRPPDGARGRSHGPDGGRRPPGGARAVAAARPRGPAVVAVRPARRSRADPRAAARGQEGPARDGGAQRRLGVRPAQDQAGQRPDRPLAGAGGAAGRARPRRGAPAHRVLRRLARLRHQRRRVDGGLRGRARPQERVPPLRRPRARRGRRHRLHAGGGPAPVQPLPRRAVRQRSARRRGRPPRSRSGRHRSGRRRSGRQGRRRHRRRALAAPRHRPRDGPAAALRLPAAARGGRRRRAAGRRRAGGPRRAGDRRRGSGGAGQAAGGGVGARSGRPGDPAAHQRGPLPPAEGQGRGAPLRHRLPPAEALEDDDGLRTGRHRRPRRDAAQGPAAPLRLAEAAPRGDGRGRHGGPRHRPTHRRGRPHGRRDRPTGRGRRRTGCVRRRTRSRRGAGLRPRHRRGGRM
ncbi:MAG: Excinuclease ABC subunit C, partial [uncultured Frankineae bacterium]